MAKPKSPLLKKGDTFVYTRAMDNAKRLSKKSMGWSELIGETLTIAKARNKGQYSLKDKDGNDCGWSWYYKVIDNHLDSKVVGTFTINLTPKKPRQWTKDTTIRSDDGIDFSKDEITLFYKDEKFTILEAQTVQRQLRSALEIHKKHFKQK